MRKLFSRTTEKRHFHPVKLAIIFAFVIISLAYTSCLDDMFISNLPDAETIVNPKDSNSMHFFVLSDWGYNGNSNQLRVASQMKKMAKLLGLDFILTSGDNFQLKGVSSVDDPLWKTNFELVYNDTLFHIPWYPALGNHDYFENPDAQVEYSKKNKYWVMPAKYYTFTKKAYEQGPVRFIVLDTQRLIQEYQNLTDKNNFELIPQYIWLKNVLANASENWIVVTGHHPVYSASIFHGDTYELKKMIKPLFDKYRVDFYICGHDHDFEHTKDPKEHTEYIVTGTGGDPRTKSRNLQTIFSLSTLGFTYFSISQDTAKFYFITASDKIGYTYSIKK